MDAQNILDEIKRMARADHAYRLRLEDNPYPENSPEAVAWEEGWRAEDDQVHAFDEEIVKLPQFRVRVEIVAGEDGADATLALLSREELGAYSVSNMRPAGPKAVTYESREARDRFPGEDNVLVRVTYEGEGGMFE